MSIQFMCLEFGQRSQYYLHKYQMNADEIPIPGYVAPQAFALDHMLPGVQGPRIFFCIHQ